MEGLLTVVHYIVSVLLIVIVLLQAGKGADIGAAFGSGGSQTLFGPRGAATLLSKITIVVAGIFLVTSISLAEIAKGGRHRSVFEKVPVPANAETIPAAPGAPIIPAAPEAQKK